MDTENLHELTAAYALDALDASDARAYETHLRECEPCRSELASFQEATAALAYGGDPATPPPELREQILAQARADRGNVRPLRPHWAYPLAGGAALATAAAVALAIWAVSLSRSLDRQRAANFGTSAAVRILADPATRHIGLSGAAGAIAVAPDGQAALIVSSLGPAPKGKSYEAWLIRSNHAVRAALFHGSRSTDVIRLERRIPRRSIVAVTLERAGGAKAPTRAPLFTAQT